MVDLFKAHGISATSSTPCNATFVQTPTKVQLVHKWNRRSTYKPWSQVHLKLHCGYLNFYTSDAKADKATVDDMQNSVVAIPVMRCDVMCVDIPGKRGFCFQVLEVPPPPYQADSLDGDKEEDEDVILPVDVSIVQSYSPNNDMTNDEDAAKAVDPSSESTMLDDMHAFLGSTNVVKKVVVVKEPKLYRFRVATAAARASWVRHIRTAQTCRAEDYLDQP
ncbi:hypothetical protein DYB28_004068 [Aphanomyces astaci]|nr:hypothetical protein DYB28_004068 [Aphanomyces astaci]